MAMVINTEVSEKLYTVEEFLNLEWSEDDDDQYELIKGEIVPKDKPGPSGKHGKIIGKVSASIITFATSGETSLGDVFSNSACTLGRPKGSNYVIPDVSFVAAGRLPEDFDGPIPLAPDLVVEVNSDSDTLERIHNKIEGYQEAGVRLIWSIYLLEKYVLVYRLNDLDIRFVNVKGELDGEDVLPGFTLKVSDLFK